MDTEAEARRARLTLGRLDGVSIDVREGGAVIDVATRAGHAAIALQGAQVLHWQPAGQSHDVLWLSPLARLGGGKAIRGGIPICWPWFGMHSDTAKPQHGYARNAPWRLTAAKRTGEDVHLDFQLAADCAGRDHLDGTAELRFRVSFGASLDIALETTNVGAKPLTITQALHTYLRVGDISRISISGLDAMTYRDNTDGGREKRQAGLVTMPRETVALFDEAPATHILTDPVLARRITVTRTGGASTVVWNPGDAAADMGDIPPSGQRDFVCIESGAIGRAAMLVPPGAAGIIGARYEVTRGDVSQSRSC